MDIASSATSLVETSLNLLGKLKELYGQNEKANQGVTSIQRDLDYIVEKIGKGLFGSHELKLISRKCFSFHY